MKRFLLVVSMFIGMVALQAHQGLVVIADYVAFGDIWVQHKFSYC